MPLCSCSNSGLETKSTGSFLSFLPLDPGSALLGGNENRGSFTFFFFFFFHECIAAERAPHFENQRGFVFFSRGEKNNKRIRFWCSAECRRNDCPAAAAAAFIAITLVSKRLPSFFFQVSPPRHTPEKERELGSQKAKCAAAAKPSRRSLT